MSYRAKVERAGDEYEFEYLFVRAETWAEAEEKIRQHYPDWEINSIEKSETKIIQ